MISYMQLKQEHSTILSGIVTVAMNIELLERVKFVRRKLCTVI